MNFFANSVGKQVSTELINALVSYSFSYLTPNIIIIGANGIHEIFLLQFGNVYFLFN